MKQLLLPSIVITGIALAPLSLQASSAETPTATQEHTQKHTQKHAQKHTVKYTGTALKTEKAKLNYSIGYQIGKNLQRQSLDFQSRAFTRGINDAIHHKTAKISEKEMSDTLHHFQQELIAKKTAEFKQLAEKNQAEETSFLNNNKTAPDVHVLSSGLQYKIIQPGQGEAPKATDTVTVNYEGRLINGTVFDSSYKRGTPATFSVNEVIAGWTEALQQMKPGAKWELFIPAKLAYGKSGVAPSIGPNETLIFKVELLSVKSSEKTAQKNTTNTQTGNIAVQSSASDESGSEQSS